MKAADTLQKNRPASAANAEYPEATQCRGTEPALDESSTATNGLRLTLCLLTALALRRATGLSVPWATGAFLLLASAFLIRLLALHVLRDRFLFKAALGSVLNSLQEIIRDHDPGFSIAG